MGRSITFAVPSDTSLFTPVQLQSRGLLRLAMEGWARWIREHLFSFAKLVHEHRFGVVVTGIQLQYLEPLRFEHDRDLEIEAAVRAVKAGALLEVTLRYRDSSGKDVARALVMVRPVLLSGDASMSATPGPVPPELLRRFEPDEVDPKGPARAVPGLVQAAEALGPPLATGQYTLKLWRHLCEVADQWSFIETAGFFGAGRESLIAARGGELPVLRGGLSLPLSHLDVELARAGFLLDELHVETQAWEQQGRPLFVHRLKTPAGALLATGVERF